MPKWPVSKSNFKVIGFDLSGACACNLTSISPTY